MNNNANLNLNNIYNLFQTEIENILTDVLNEDARNNIQTSIQTTINNLTSRNSNVENEQSINNTSRHNTTSQSNNTTIPPNNSTRQSNNTIIPPNNSTRQPNNTTRQPTNNYFTRNRTNSFSDANSFYNYNPQYTSYYADNNINVNEYYYTLTNIASSLNNSIYENNNNIRLYQQNLLFILQELRYIRPRIFQSNNRNMNYRQSTSPNTNNNNINQNNINVLRRHINIPNDITSINNNDLLYFYLSPYLTSRHFNNSESETGRLLTNNEITLSTRRLNYNNIMNETRCPISLEDFSENEEIMEIIGCGHIFKTNNLLEWLSRESNCPVCRYNILNYINNTVNRNNTESESESETENNNSMSSEPTIIASVEFEIDTE